MQRTGIIGSILIFLGAMVWPVYGILEYLTPHELGVAPFLGLHLSLVIPGALLGGRGIIRRILSRLNK